MSVMCNASHNIEHYNFEDFSGRTDKCKLPLKYKNDKKSACKLRYLEWFYTFYDIYAQIYQYLKIIVILLAIIQTVH